MKKILVLFLLLSSLSMSAQKKSYQLSGGVLDSATGKSTDGIKIRLEKYDVDSQEWSFVEERITGSPERFLERKEGVSRQGIYKMTYYTGDYFEKMGIESIFPFVEVNIKIVDDSDYLIPLIITPFGYSTYKGNGYSNPPQTEQSK